MNPRCCVLGCAHPKVVVEEVDVADKLVIQALAKPSSAAEGEAGEEGERADWPDGEQRERRRENSSVLSSVAADVKGGAHVVLHVLSAELVRLAVPRLEDVSIDRRGKEEDKEKANPRGRQGAGSKGATPEPGQ